MLEQFGVAGVQRQFIMESVVQQLGLDVVETTLNLESLFAADEVFLANSITGLWPVTHCYYKEHNYSWDVGMVTRSLQAMCHNVFFDG